MADGLRDQYVQAGYESDVGVLFFTLFRTCHRTRSRVAMESSTEEWPDEPSPVWIEVPMCSFTLVGHGE